MLDLSIVIPIHNEARSIPELYNRLKNTLDALHCSYELIFVNDASNDNSLAILSSLSNKDNKLTTITFSQNRGQHRALFEGIKSSRGEKVIIMDGDLQEPPEEIPKLINKLGEGFDAVCGKRFQKKTSLPKRLFALWGNSKVAKITGVAITDYGSPFWGMSREVVGKLLRMENEDMIIPLMIALSSPLKTTEVSIQHAERKYGESHYNILTMVKLAYRILGIYSPVPTTFRILIGPIMSLLLVLSFAIGILLNNISQHTLAEVVPIAIVTAVLTAPFIAFIISKIISRQKNSKN